MKKPNSRNKLSQATVEFIYQCMRQPHRLHSYQPLEHIIESEKTTFEKMATMGPHTTYKYTYRIRTKITQ